MDLHSSASVLIALVAIGAIVYRQLRWRAFDPARALRIPVVLGVLGGIELVAASTPARVGPLDLLLLGIGLAVSLGIGFAMGHLVAFRPDPAVVGGVQSRAGWLGAALWAVLLVLRIGLDLAAGALGSSLVTSSGTILVLIALTRATSAIIARSRAPRAVPLSA